MNRRRMLLVLAVQLGLIQAAPASIFSLFRRSRPPVPQRVPELIQILRSDPRGDRRLKAAAELRQYDPAAFPEIVPTLMETLQRDALPAVRAEAAESLGKMRALSSEVTSTLEKAMASDPAPRVRAQAATALGRHSKKSWFSRPSKDDGPTLTPPPGTATTNEPPLADPNTPLPIQTPAPAQGPVLSRP